jgi:predicted DsbA family dithiol-disulfide isomerase
VDADIRWHPFELNPGMVKQGEDIAAHVRRKYGRPPEAMRETRSAMAEIAAEAGVALRPGVPSRIWNTHDAHRLLHWAKASGRQTALKLALFRRYFEADEDMSDHQVLLAAVSEAGLDPEEAAGILATDTGSAEVRALEERFHDMGISGVPAVIVAEKGLVLGAQGTERYRAVIRRFSAPSASA